MTGGSDVNPGSPRNGEARRHRRVAIVCSSIVVGMVGLSFAAVPLYRMFCQVTGFGGVAQRADKPSTVTLDRGVPVRFDANVAKGLPWVFEPVQRTLDVKIGENVLAYYRATNTSDKPIKATAAYNVSPDVVGIHFNKVECFCFTEQTLAPGETVDMPLSFYIDPAIVSDRDAWARAAQITISYTFYAVEDANAAPGGARAAIGGGGKGS